jgi:hypothetical protein
MNHCSSLPATCTPPPLQASGPRTLLKSTRPLSAFPPAHSQPHLIWHDALHPSPGHKVAIVALVRRASRPLAETASSLAAVDRPPAFQLPATCIQMRVPVVVPLGPLAHPVSADSRAHPTAAFPSALHRARPDVSVVCPPVAVVALLSCPAITIPSAHIGLHISVYQPPTQLLATLRPCPPCPSDSPPSPLPSPSPHCPRPPRSPRSPRFTRPYTASPLRSRELRSHYDN